MKIEVKLWQDRSAGRVVATLEMSQLSYGPERGVFVLRGRDADTFYPIESPPELQPNLVVMGEGLNTVFFEREADAVRFARWLEEAARESG